MNTDHYLLTGDEMLPVYYFISQGSKGNIKKGVFFQLIDEERKLFNLAFGDWDESTSNLDDLARTNNYDTQKVLNTVAIAVLDFMDKNPDARLFAKGSTESRTRLYQINIRKNIVEISREYVVEGFRNGCWEAFEKNVNYEGFLLIRRLLTL
ncbi:DUF6934 family protein [Dyadobacter sp. OTU695]|uniref:DUF6934 family protein n=1 Tax=Dyadobacter sp. OTU695 TaxID=3043860 RepID=UPI00313ECB60